MRLIARLVPRTSAASLVRSSMRSLSSDGTNVSLTFVDQDGNAKPVRATVGKTVLEAALASDIDIEAACGGEMACSTCHVILDADTYEEIGDPSEEEQDMLDLAWGLTKTYAMLVAISIDVSYRSRLSCQIKVTPNLDGTKYTLPEEPKL